MFRNTKISGRNTCLLILYNKIHGNKFLFDINNNNFIELKTQLKLTTRVKKKLLN